MSNVFIEEPHGVGVEPDRRRRRGLIVVVVMLLVALIATGTALIAYASLSASIKTVDIGAQSPDKGAPFVPYEGGFNILIAGSDKRTEKGVAYTGDPGSGARNDVTMLLHVAKDHSSATVVSFPRDMMVQMPDCVDAETGRKVAGGERRQINEAIGRGGLGCVAKTVESLTGTSVPFAAEVSFDGVIKMSDAVGGVPVCFTTPVKDDYSGLNVPKAGAVTLTGGQALAFLRSRHGVGDGSDLARISTQQLYLSSLVRTLKSEATLTDPGKVSGLARVALESMTFSSDLGDIGTMTSLGRALADVPLDAVSFVTYPYSQEGERVVPHPRAAAVLKEALASDKPIDASSFVLGRGSRAGESSSSGTPSTPATSSPSATPSAGTPAQGFTFEGQQATDDPCVIGAR
jgi:LCP family protein required for cell wall assembly